MKNNKLIPGIILVSVWLLLFASTVQAAAAGSQIDLALSKSRIKVGDTLTADILVKSAPSIYGADVRLEFDPTFLQVVDQDTVKDGIQVVEGDFINARKSFFLQNQVLNEQGAVDYALTLLNPAPAVEGNGRLVRVVFQALKSGQTSLRIVEGQFGTRTGELINPVLGSANLQISAGRTAAVAGTSGDQTGNQAGDVFIPLFGLSVPSETLIVTGFVGTGFLGAAIASLWIKAKRSHRA